MFFQVQSFIFCSVKLFAGVAKFLDMNCMTAHTEALLVAGHSYDIARTHFIRN